MSLKSDSFTTRHELIIVVKSQEFSPNTDIYKKYFFLNKSNNCILAVFLVFFMFMQLMKRQNRIFGKLPKTHFLQFSDRLVLFFISSNNRVPAAQEITNLRPFKTF